MITQSNIAGRPHSIEVNERNLSLCGIKSRYAQDLDREETQALMNWCDWQSEGLWEGLNLQEILNVYRASAEYVSWEEWATEDWRKAYRAWNNACHVSNAMEPRE